MADKTPEKREACGARCMSGETSGEKGVRKRLSKKQPDPKHAEIKHPEPKHAEMNQLESKDAEKNSIMQSEQSLPEIDVQLGLSPGLQGSLGSRHFGLWDPSDPLGGHALGALA